LGVFILFKIFNAKKLSLKIAFYFIPRQRLTGKVFSFRATQFH